MRQEATLKVLVARGSVTEIDNRSANFESSIAGERLISYEVTHLGWPRRNFQLNAKASLIASDLASPLLNATLVEKIVLHFAALAVT